MEKAPEAFRTISEVAEEINVPQHVLRFWESRFAQIKPMKRGGGRRYYRPDDVDLLRGVRHLLYGEGYTIRGVQRILREEGVSFVQKAWRGDSALPPPDPEDADEAADSADAATAEAPDSRAGQCGTRTALDFQLSVGSRRGPRRRAGCGDAARTDADAAAAAGRSARPRRRGPAQARNRARRSDGLPPHHRHSAGGGLFRRRRASAGLVAWITRVAAFSLSRPTYAIAVAPMAPTTQACAGGCAVGTPPANLGFRLVRDEAAII